MVIHALRSHFALRTVGVSAGLLLAAWYLATFMKHRAAGEMASFGTTRIVPTSSEFDKYSTDVVALVCAAALMLIAVFAPLATK
jgi:hypothetical protein